MAAIYNSNQWCRRADANLAMHGCSMHGRPPGVRMQGTLTALGEIASFMLGRSGPSAAEGRQWAWGGGGDE